MQNQQTGQILDFTSSFRRSLKRFDQISAGRKADYERSNEKEKEKDSYLVADVSAGNE